EYCKYEPIFFSHFPIGEFAFNIIAADADGDPLIYSLRGENSFYFSVNQSTGNVTIRAVMDREASSSVPLRFAVSDGVHTEVSKVIRIILDDANDNRPMFDPPSYDIDVLENIHANTSLFHVSANDPDIGLAKIVVYKIDNVVPNDGVDLFSVSDRTGEVKLTGHFNYTSKSTFYQLKINASDSGGLLHGQNVVQSSSAFASITVIDVPDLDPQFINLPYAATVNENTAVASGHTVLKVQAVDPDTGVNARILYSIQKSTSAPDLFEIDENTGDIMIKNIFDREDFLDINAAVILQVLAQETTQNIHGIFARTSTDVKIAIGDINDNKPRFYDCQAVSCDLASESTNFKESIDEHSVGEPVTGMHIFAQDSDQGANAKFTLHLDGPDKDAFSVFPLSATSDTQVQIYIKNPQAVDYEVIKSMEVKLIANDSSNADCCSTATITIQINDVNDNSPVFEYETYNLNIAEHSQRGTIIATITATDPDTADVDNITYRLLPQSILKYFDVDQKTGSIKVVDGNLLDREVSYFFTATLQATDSDKNVGRTILVITLLDINDMTPHIPRETYPEFVKEGPNPHLSVLIQATDVDQEDSDNSKIQYRIEPSKFSDNFTIDRNTGLLQNNGPLDREAIDLLFQGAIILNVTATDMGVPPRSTGVMVIVNVEDVNDNTPKFKNHTYKFFAKECNKGAFVGSVFADDKDQTIMNNRISFRITDGSLGNFIVTTSAEERGSGYVGNISVDPDVELDYEKGKKSYSLTIEATDMGQRRDFALAEVIVLDVNDERPVLSGDFTLHVPENTTDLGEVGKIEAEDPDSNSSLIYELLSTQCQCNGTLGPCAEDWFTVASTGAIIVNKEFVIDYEKCDKVVLETQVVDVFTEKGDNHSLPGKLEIRINDINDNAPSFFKSDGLFVVLSEKTEQGTVVASFTATDQDSGSNKLIYFDVLSVELIDSNNALRQMDKIFSVEAIAVQNYYKGDIRCTGSLDSTLKGKYLVTVEAKDSGNLTSDIQLEIYTIDKSFRVGLRFQSSVSEVNTNLNRIQWALSAATKSTVRILDVVAESMEPRALEIIVLGAYFILPNGSALNSDSVETILQEDLYHANVLRKYGLTYIVSGGTDVKEVDLTFLVLLGLVAGLVIVLVVTITSLVCIQRSYQRKLKAAKAMSTSAMKSENTTCGAVVPGTNKYTTEGANPVLNLNIDGTTDLIFDEEGSSADKVSLNSFDYNIEMDMTERDTMTIIQEEDEETADDQYPGAGLAQVQQDSNNCFDNPALSTTDL
ncbi:cadherin-related family member 2-like, partial [Arapaima gigas]